MAFLSFSSFTAFMWASEGASTSGTVERYNSELVVVLDLVKTAAL